MHRENQMVISSRRKHFTECVGCQTTLIFPEKQRCKETSDFQHCPVCGQQFSMTEAAVSGQTSDDQRLEDFFARFS